MEVPKKQFPPTKPEPEIDRVKSSQPLSAQPKPIARLRCSPIPRESTEIHIPKPIDPKGTPRKNVLRKIAHRYRKFGGFWSKVETLARREFIEKRQGNEDVPHFPEFYTHTGKEALKDIFLRLLTEFQDFDEIYWLLSSRWKGKFSELHIYLIACGVWDFILDHCEDVESDEGQAEEIEQEMQDPQEELPAKAAENAEQGAERSATNGAQKLDRAEQPKKRAGRKKSIAVMERARILWKHFPDGKFPVSFEDKRLKKAFTEIDSKEIPFPHSTEKPDPYRKYNTHSELLAMWVERTGEKDSASGETFFTLEILMQTFKKTLQRHPRNSVQGQK